MKYRAFVSSTYEDLKEHRAHVVSSLRRAGIFVDPMEDWTADNDEPKKFSQDRLDGCDLCVLLVAFRGYIPDGETLSITQLEYETALKKGIDILPFVLDDDAPWRAKYDERDKDPEIVRWRAELRKRHGVQPFYLDPGSIDMTGPLGRWLSQNSRPRQVNDPAERPASKLSAPETVTWDTDKDGSPYPGLMHFTRKYARVFFGRDDEIREILYRMLQPEGRFIIISGDSGVGKSSVIDAGILPKLEDGGLPTGELCVAVRMLPGQTSQPFSARGTTFRSSCARLTGAGATPATATSPLVFVLPRTSIDPLFFFLLPFAAAKPPIFEFLTNMPPDVPKPRRRAMSFLLRIIPQLGKFPTATDASKKSPLVSLCQRGKETCNAVGECFR